MPFIVRITTDEDAEDLKFFTTFKDAERRFNSAWLLMREELDKSIGNEHVDPYVVGRLRTILGITYIERIELHECKSTQPLEAVNEIRNNTSYLRHWRDYDHPYGDILEDLIKDIEDTLDHLSESKS